MWLIPGFPIALKVIDPPHRHAATRNPVLVPHPHRGRAIMRQMFVAAAIAAGLVALWAALLPLAA
jgi:hypothetical protein